MSVGKNNGTRIPDTTSSKSFLVFTDTWKGPDGRQEHRFASADDWQRFMLGCVGNLTNYPLRLYEFRLRNKRIMESLKVDHPSHVEAVESAMSKALELNGKDKTMLNRAFLLAVMVGLFLPDAALAAADADWVQPATKLMSTLESGLVKIGAAGIGIGIIIIGLIACITTKLEWNKFGLVLMGGLLVMTGPAALRTLLAMAQ